MKLSVIVPVFNERRTIALILEKVRAVPLEKEIIVVDGGSFDGTREVLRTEEEQSDTRVIYEPTRRGRGRAIKEGLAAATGDIVIFQDADLELDPADYPALVAPLLAGEADVVFGSRFLHGRPVMTFMQYWGNQAVNAAVNLLYGTHLTDVETCYQVFRREAIDGMILDNNDFAFTIELTVKLIRRGYRIREIPIKYIPRGRLEGKKIYWGDGFWALWTLLKYRFATDQEAAVHDQPGFSSSRIISEFYGLKVSMGGGSVIEPHFAVDYRGRSFEMSIAHKPILISGDAPPRALILCAEWVTEHYTELIANWERLQKGERLQSIFPLQ